MTPTATKDESTFRLTYAVRCEVRASPEAIFRLLTDAARFTEWNSTVTRLEGPIELGRTLALEVAAAPGRVFTPKVTVLEAATKMVWSDGTAPFFTGVRTFTLAKRSEDVTELAMTEELAGVMLPLVKRSLPDFRPVFERYAADLKRAAEAS